MTSMMTTMKTPNVFLLVAIAKLILFALSANLITIERPGHVRLITAL